MTKRLPQYNGLYHHPTKNKNSKPEKTKTTEIENTKSGSDNTPAHEDLRIFGVKCN
jgi:hypothetical protein